MLRNVRPKIRIFGLVELRDVESKKFLSKSCTKNQNLKHFKFWIIPIPSKEISITLGTLDDVGIFKQPS